MDLSSPKDHSVNDGIAGEWSSLTYTTVNHLVSTLLNVGRGCLLVKANIKEAYQMIPVHPIQWRM